MAKKVAVSVFLTVAVLLMGAASLRKVPREGEVTIKGETLKVEVAQTPYQMERGLSGRSSLPQGRGIVFVFSVPGFYGFWMKEMNFPIDIIWIGPDFKVVGISSDVSPSTYPKVFTPEVPAQYVLEVAAGWSEKNNISVGNAVQLNL